MIDEELRVAANIRDGTIETKAHLAERELEVRTVAPFVLVNGKEYEGPYEFTPSEEVQTIPVGGLVGRKDITVNPIPSNYGRIEFDGATLSVI